MPTNVERTRLKRLLRETLGLVGEKGAEAETPTVVNEPPIQAVVPTPSVDGSEVGNVKSQPAFETNSIMRKLGKLLSKLSDKQQASVYKKLKNSVQKKDSTNESVYLAAAVNKILTELDDEPEWMHGAQGPSAADLEAIESGDEDAGEFTPEEVDDDLAQQIPGEFQRRAALTDEELATVDLTDRSLRVGKDALTIAEIIDAISIQVGVSRSAVTNILYDYMKKVGDSQIRRRPSERRKIPTSADPEKLGTASAVETMLYSDFREEMEGYGDTFPELVENPYPEDINSLPENDYRRELFRNYARLFLMTQYGSDIRSSVDLISNWHNLADETGNPPREHGNGKPHSEEASLHGFIVGDVRELMGNMNSNDFEQYLRRAQALIDADKTAGGQGWKGVVGKIDKEAEKIAKKKAKAAKKK